MPDERLRQLERRWQETGSVQDEAAYLLERVRVGDLSRERLELAAYCGHEGAREALGEDAPEVPEDLKEWLLGLAPFSPAHLLVVTAATFRQILQIEEDNDPLGLSGSITALEGYAAHLCDEGRTRFVAECQELPPYFAWTVDHWLKRGLELLGRALEHEVPNEAIAQALEVGCRAFREAELPEGLARQTVSGFAVAVALPSGRPSP